MTRQIFRHGRQFLNHVVPAVMKPARTLWNEVIGFLFLCLAVIIGSHDVKAYLAKQTWDVILATPLTLVFAYYGISSFLRARKISRS